MLDQKLQQLNRIKLSAYISGWFIHIVTSIAAALLVGSLAQVLHAPTPLMHMLLCGFIFLLTLGCFRRRDDNITRTALLLTLDHDYASTSPAPYAVWQDDSARKNWQVPLRQQQRKIVSFEIQRLRAAAGRALLITIACLAVAWQGDLSWQQLLPAYRYLTLHTPEAILTVLPTRERRIALQASAPPQIELAAGELALVEVMDDTLSANPVLQLRRAGEVWQSVQLRPRQQGHYAVTLSIDRNSTLHIDAVAAGQSLAHLHVTAQEAPQLKLSAANKIDNPHPDEIPLPLSISAVSSAPLANVKLLITTGGGTYEELVNTFVNTRREHHTVYSFVAESYVERDVAEIELVAAARTRAGAIGYSAPLTINTISAWGRYRRSLAKLKEVKTVLDETLTQTHRELSVAAIVPTMRAAIDFANISPFFDAQDRLTMAGILDSLEDNRDLSRRRELALASARLNEFLLEHEVLNDRERDRDFFPAARHLSWIIARGDRAISKYVQRLDRFLVERRKRWQVRTKTLPAVKRPVRWQDIEEHEPFRTGLAQLPEDAAQARDALTALVGAYRQWLSALEKAEDEHYRQQVQQVQQVLNAAQEELRAMQQRQAHISTYLDKAAQRDIAELQQGWAATRMRQHTNIRAAKPLQQSLQAVSPLAAQRLQSAAQAMQATVDSGEAQDYVLAESHADLAGRLLRYTRSATQQRLPARRQRRRTLAGDRYHGQPVIGGYIELQRDYRVNRRYREDILEEVRRSNLLEKHRDLLDAYLRKVVR